MKTLASDIETYVRDLEGLAPWRARRGYGSFLTFDFGRRVMRGGHWYGEWHLWIYLSNWQLTNGLHELANSDSERRLIDLSVRRLEGVRFRSVEFTPKTSRTIFWFGSFKLSVSPANYIEEPSKRDEYWLLFRPDDKVVGVGPAGLRARPAHLQALASTR